VTVDVYSDADEIELLLDGVTVGRAPVERFRAAVETTYRAGTLAAVAYVEGVESGRVELTTAGTSLVLEAKPDRTDLRADGTDLGYVSLTLTDANGIARNGVDRP
ncbi:DUF4982 domain-containing protein, partial [Rhizobium johnstonii]|uniref:DUF4982 domain-containing protein n=1 Tax=Rhizobium johnstonii TaxID=3019933 RepID=UPI003F9777EE